MRFLLDADDDWIEALRRWLWPKLHPILDPFGLYVVGEAADEQHVVTLDIDEEEFEHTLVELGFVRNPIACYKHTTDGRLSEGSWVLLPPSDPLDVLEGDEQLHVTLFNDETLESSAEDSKALRSASAEQKDGLAVYAHSEYDWRDRPKDHLDEVYFSPSDGVEHTNRLLIEETDLL